MVPASFLKWMLLALLIVQSVGFGVILRQARLRPGPRFSDLTAVICSEILKLVLSFAMIAAESGATGVAQSLRRMCCEEQAQTVLMGIPGTIFLIQNWLFLVGGANLSVAMYQSAKQAAIPATAILSVVCLGKQIDTGRSISLLVLVAGVSLVTAQGDSVVNGKGNMKVGLSCVLAATLCSAAASVFTEAMMKSNKCTMWERNVQLSLVGIVLGGSSLAMGGMDRFNPDVFFRGYTWHVWLMVLLQSFGGLLTAAVLKHADSIMKCVAKAVAFLASVSLSRAVFGEGPSLDTARFQIGTLATIVGATVYSLGCDTLGDLFCWKSGEPCENACAVEHSATIGKQRAPWDEEPPLKEDEAMFELMPLVAVSVDS
mmetsp:Transcript_131875/g.421935  ORF Transcript_131875/g.421935 Transcript_131875/m.421935 type:complete len:372 (+) Transcript_131875:90-1205(+)